ncbi:MAG: methionine adenosyltransferase [Planctomycetes bacterium]|nr:methionine adenosyltransferase [Planctomycetota bacterium]
MARTGRRLFTSESVSMGHPDKIADQISDAILDAHLEKDPNARVACEVMVKTGVAIVSGEITSSASVDYQDVTRKTIKEIGYDDSRLGYDGETCGVLVLVSKQSPDIDMGVSADKNARKEQGAGDQGLMFGFACDETEELMPLPLMLAHKLVMAQTEARKSRTLPFLRPDGKSQVTIEYEGFDPVRIHTVVLSTQHDPDVTTEDLRAKVLEKVIKPVLPKNLVDDKTIFHINPTGRFVYGGPYADCGLTGRKIIVDTYGGMGSHGGGSFSGKDPSKVDRSASYFARYVAKNIVKAGLARRCELQVAYAIGVAQPVSILVDTKGTGKVDDEKIEQAVKKLFDFRPAAMIETLDLKKPIFKETARFGHFGRSIFRWEQTDRVKELKKAAGL